MCRSLRNRIIGGATVGAALLLGSLSAFATNSLDCASGDGFGRKQLRVVGLTGDGQLVCFNENSPRRARDIGYVSGLVSPDTALIGIDFRVQDGQLYGVGNGGGVYRIDTDNAAAVRVNSLTEALSGTSFGVDFNPAADRLRVVSNTGQNLRHNVNMGGTTIPDGTLNYVAGTAAPGIEGAAYTNNDVDAATVTTLFDLDTNLDQIVIQAPPNNGPLNPTGKLGVDVGPAAGFDIYSTLFRGVTIANRGYAVLNVNGEYCFYRINVLTGAATYVGSFKDVVVDIAIPLNQ